jgi:hypothetical protein
MTSSRGFLITGILILLVISDSSANDSWGLIVHDHYDCQNDHMAVQTESGWLLAEAYPPYSPLQEGAYIMGPLNGYGFEEVLVFSSMDDDSPEEAKIYIDNYWMSEQDAAVYCFEGEDL